VKHVFIDTDILIDFLTQREPFGKSATKLFNRVAKGNLIVSVSSLSLAKLAYVLRKQKGDIRKQIGELTQHVQVEPFTKKHLQEALNSSFTDFEDALQHAIALSTTGAEAVITRNIRDFKESRLPVFTPSGFLAFEGDNEGEPGRISDLSDKGKT